MSGIVLFDLTSFYETSHVRVSSLARAIYLARLQKEQIVTPDGSRVPVESNVLQHEIIWFCDNVLGFGASVDTTNIIQIVLPEIYRQDRTETALKDGLHLGKMMMLEFKLGVLDPIPRLLVGVCMCIRRQAEMGADKIIKSGGDLVMVRM